MLATKMAYSFDALYVATCQTGGLGDMVLHVYANDTTAETALTS